jgi:two-component system response regulator VicR
MRGDGPTNPHTLHNARGAAPIAAYGQPGGPQGRDRARAAQRSQRMVSRMAKRILIIDDEQPIADLLAETFAREGYDTTRTTESLRFFDAVQAVKPDLILLDLRMNYLTGEDELRLLNLFPEVANIPVIVVTADHDAPSKATMYRSLGVVKIITKPFNLDDIIAAVQQTIGSPQEVAH